MSEHQHVQKREEYRATLSKMADDLDRSPREREVERVHGKSMPVLLSALLEEHNDNVSAALRAINEPDEMESNVSRRTFYGWMSRYEVRDR